MGRFAQALGILQLNAGGLLVELTPKMGDKRKILDCLKNSGEKEVQIESINKLADVIVAMVIRDNPDENREEVGLWVEHYINDLIQQILVGFNFTTEAKLKELEKKE